MAHVYSKLSVNVTRATKANILRADTVKYIRANVIYFNDFTSCDPDENLPFDKYLDKIEKPQQMVGEYMLRAIANVVSKPSRVYYCQSAPRVYYPDSSPVNNSDHKSVEVINIENCLNPSVQ